MRLLQEGERRGRGQAAAAEVPDLYRVVHACPDTLAVAREKVLILTGFHYASRAQDPAGLLFGDVALTPRGLVVSVLTGRPSTASVTRRSSIRMTRSLPGGGVDGV